MQLWCQFIDQGQDMVNPKLSSYAVLEGQFNINKTSLAPIGTKSLVLLTANKQNTWKNHTVDAWYVGLAKRITETIRFTYQKQEGTELPHQLIFSLNSAKCPQLNWETHQTGSTRPHCGDKKHAQTSTS
ncbi:hypothetical protein ACHAW6_013116 [Cyclotella cf. meneghiniana]